MQMTQCTLFSYLESFLFSRSLPCCRHDEGVPEDPEAAAELRAQMTSPVNVAGNAGRLFKKEATVQLQPLPECTWEKLG